MKMIKFELSGFDEECFNTLCNLPAFKSLYPRQVLMSLVHQRLSVEHSSAFKPVPSVATPTVRISQTLEEIAKFDAELDAIVGGAK